MRWDQLFTDLENQFADLLAEDSRIEVADQQRHYAGGLIMRDRLQGALGESVTLETVNGRTILGQLAQVGADWMLLHATHHQQVLLPYQALAAISGLTTRTGVGLSPLDLRIDLRIALRGLARDRRPVRVELLSSKGEETGYLTGTIDRIGRDFLELAHHEPGELRRAAQVRKVVLIPLNALVAVYSAVEI